MDPVPPIQSSPIPPPMQPVPTIAPHATRWGMLGAVALFAGVIGAGAYFVLNQGPDYADFVPTYTPRPSASTTPTSTVPADWKTYTNTQYGFEFKYPPEWSPKYGEESGNPRYYEILGRVVNPAYPGKEDTDVPTEQFLIRGINDSCKGNPATLLGRSVKDTGWIDGLGETRIRDICVEADIWPTTITLIAVAEINQTKLEMILSTFRFTK